MKWKIKKILVRWALKILQKYGVPVDVDANIIFTHWHTAYRIHGITRHDEIGKISTLKIDLGEVYWDEKSVI